MTSSAPVISVGNISISYPIQSEFIKWKQYCPLGNGSFDVFKDETVGLIGRNGAGKSSLTHMIAGNADPDAGNIATYGVSVSLLVLVSHQTNIIKALCDRVVWIDNGEVGFVGNTAEGLLQYDPAMVKS